MSNNNNSNNTTNNTTNNNTTNSNNTTNNTININLVPFGMENINDLSLEDKEAILKAGHFCTVLCTKKLNCNPNLPQYHNIAYTNLRSNDAKIYGRDKTWKTINKEDLFERIIINRAEDVRSIMENDDIELSSYLQSLLEQGVDLDEILKDNNVKQRFFYTLYDFNQNKPKSKITQN